MDIGSILNIVTFIFTILSLVGTILAVKIAIYLGTHSLDENKKKCGN